MVFSALLRRDRRLAIVIVFTAAVTIAALLIPSVAHAAGHRMRFTHTMQPTINGAPIIGRTLTARPGRWKPQPTSWTYLWRKDGVAISGAGGPRYRVRPDDVGERITVVVTGHRRGFAIAKRLSARTTPVVRAFTAKPVPVVIGIPRVGETLQVTAAPWSPEPGAVRYSWFADGDPIAGATATSLRLDASLRGARISAAVTASRSGYATTTVTTAPTSAVRGELRVMTVSGGGVSGIWSTADADEYHVTGSIAVGGNQTLDIAAGTSVVIDAGATLTVDGVLRTSGTAAAPVTMGSSAAVPAAGDWSGILVRSGGRVELEGATVSDTTFAVDTSGTPSGVVIRDSALIRSSEGVRVQAGGITLEQTKVTGGVEVLRGESPATDHDTVSISGDTVIAGPLLVSSRNSSPTASPVVVRDNTVSAVQSPGQLEHTTAFGTVYPLNVFDVALRPSAVTGNRVIGNRLNAIAVGGTLVEDWTLPVGGTQYVVDGECCGGGMLEVASGVRLTVPAGAALRMADRASLWVSGDLRVTGTPSAPAVITAATDDSAGLPIGYGGAPTAGLWRGVTARFGGTVELASARIDYAQEDLRGYQSVVTVSDSLLLHATWASALEQGSASIVRSTVDGGLTVHRRSAIADPTAQIVVRNDVITDGPLTVLSENADPTSSPVVVEDTVVRDDVAPVYANPNYPIQVWDAALRPSTLTGDSMTGGGQPAFAVGGTLVEDWTLPADAWHYVLSAAFNPRSDVGEPTVQSSDMITALTVAAGHTLTLPAGSVLKVERSERSSGTEHVFVAGALATDGSTADPAILTTVTDDSVGGDLNGDGSTSTPAAGDWSGLLVSGSGVIPATGLDVRYG